MGFHCQNANYKRVGSTCLLLSLGPQGLEGAWHISGFSPHFLNLMSGELGLFRGSFSNDAKSKGFKRRMGNSVG